MSFQVQDETGEGGTIALDKAILLYGDGSKAVATIHDVRRDKGKATIMPGRGISLANLQDLVIALTTEKKSSYLPDNVLACSFTKLVWWTPSCVRPIWFKTNDRKFTRSMNGAKVTHPAMLFCVSPDGVQAWALSEDKRPKPDTQLYRAPYYNVWETGKMCTGNAAVPKLLMPSTIPKFEAAFFNSAFTHTNIAGNKLTRHPGGHNGFWTALRGRGKHPRRKRISPKWLFPIGITLQKVIDA